MIFYSWQSDLPDAVGKSFVREAISNAIAALPDVPGITDAPRLDHDTQGIGGTPEIAGTIFTKIEQSAVFVADVSLTQASTEHCGSSKRSPNPNVMLELGYAAAKLGWDRIVLVMNERYGGVSKLPFDLRNRRWPITYALSANQTQPAMLADDLSTRLAAMIGQSLASDYQRAEDAIAKLAPQARRLMKRLGANSALTDGGGENRSAVGRDEFYAQQLLNLGILRTTDADSNLQYQYTWTYLGRECCRRIGVAIPNEQSIPEFNQSKNVLTDLTAFDELEPADRSAHE